MSPKRRIQTFLEDLRSILMEDMICMIPFVFFDWMWHIYNQTLCTSSLLTSCCTISQCFCWIPFIFAWTQPLPLLLHLLKNKKSEGIKIFIHSLSAFEVGSSEVNCESACEIFSAFCTTSNGYSFQVEQKQRQINFYCAIYW